MNAPVEIATKILLAEDDNDMRRFLVKALQTAGYNVASFDNGLSAYNRLREEPFELLLTDIVMPEMDGIELARRATELDPEIKVMFITGFAAVALNPDNNAPQGRAHPVQALSSERPRQRGAEAARRLTEASCSAASSAIIRFLARWRARPALTRPPDAPISAPAVSTRPVECQHGCRQPKPARAGRLGKREIGSARHEIPSPA